MYPHCPVIRKSSQWKRRWMMKKNCGKDLRKHWMGAIAQFVQTRTVEGENLKKDLIAKLDGMLELVGQIEERAPKIIAEYREKLEGKVKELLEDTQIDEGADRIRDRDLCGQDLTDEEVVRLRSHVEHMKATLQSDDSGIGRKLDFIAQGDEQMKRIRFFRRRMIWRLPISESNLRQRLRKSESRYRILNKSDC